MAAPGGRARWGATLRSTWFKVTAAVAAAAALGAGAFLAGGYDTAQTKVDDASVWALQTGQGERYARVDTALGQLDTVKSVTSPNDIVQADGQVVVYAQGNASGAQVDLAQPASFTAASLKPTPAGTKQVFSTGDYVGYLSSTGEVRAGRIEQGVQSGGPAIAAPGSGGKRAFAADTIAIGTDGVLYAYSHIAHQVLRFDIPTGRTLGTDSLANGPDDASASMTVVGSTWVLLDGDGAHMWVRGVAGRLTTRLGDKAVLQKPSGAESVVVAASGTELVAYDLATGRRYPALASGQNGEPAAPTWAGTRLYAAWLTQDAGPGHLWIGAARMGRQPSTYRVRNLGYGSIAGKPGQLSNDITPEFRTNGSAMILNDSSSGWVWSVPSGQLVQGSQNWDLGQTTSTRTDTRQIDQTRESDPTPPVAVDDQFGVRAGSLVTLPVMLNDYDANGDVISIVPGSVTGLDPRFGTASVADSGQTITVQVQPNAPPTATFTYEVTDGTTKNGLDSAPATVTLTVHPASQNGAPVWCNGYSAEECLVTWPDNTEVAQGGSVEIPILRGWVDPDGDPMFATATGLSDPADTVSVTPDGNLVFQAAAGSRTGDVDVAVTVSDVLGATTTKTLHLKVVARSTITVENFGLMTAVGVPLTVDPSTHIRSAQGTPQIVNASLPSSTTANIAIDSSGATFQFEAADVGSYPVTMTVKDPATGATATATVRITVVSDAQPTISTAPVTVFVRPDTDTSVDVFSAVQNPTGRVLLLSDPQPDPAPGASLDVDVVGQAQLRVRGTTGSGAPGLLGTVHYVVSDGTDSPGMRVNGVASVYLLPNALPGRPVAIDDSVTVRAGAQVDVPVLANDVGQGGDFVELDPSRIVNESHQGLAFASGQLLRLLAPDHATTYTIRYSAYSAGNPSAESTASVHVTVLPQGSDRPPRPVTLTGRVAAGEKVRIPFNPFGIDPDGDMVSLDRISQPKQGTAQITPDGTAIIYTAAPGGEGQQSFSYEVRDSEGETGQGTVMVGVLKNAQTDPAPVTYSDYVQVKAGAGNRVVVQPTDNDIDPNGGALTLGAVTPDVPSGSAQYAALAGAIISKSGGEVVIRATPRPRTLTYVYSVTNAQGDVSEGLIVVDVVSGDVPDWPVAVDTVVDAQSRSRLAEGIDVLAGKVSWGAGEVGALTLSVPGAPSGVSVVGGDAIRVAHVPASGMIVPFKLTGKDFTGHEAWTYGFLRIPALADVILTLKSGFPPLTVKEGGSGQVQLANWINAPSDSPLNFATDAKTTGTRPGSSCEITADGTLTYNAGLRAPWTDACTIEVQTLTQKDFTKIAIPIEITPLQPEPQLRPASLTESPGQPALHYDLAQMVTWLDHENEIPSMDYAVAYSGTQFTVVRQGSEVVVTAKDDARPGTVEQATVTLPGHPGVTATITLKVGPVASQRPAGGSTTLSCSEANGTSCTTTVVGLSDEINAFPGTPLQVVGVASQVPGCTGVTFAVSSTRTVTAKWSADAPGGTCTVPFTVQDAQGRRSTSTGSGSGALSFELKGYPAAPASVTQVGYTGTSVTLAIAPGDAATAYPAITGFVVTMDGQSAVTCTAAGVCPAVTGLQNGAKHVFEARAVNEVGLSKAGVTTTAWAFAQPTVTGVTATPVYDPSLTTASTGAFDLTIPNRDASTASYVVQWGGQSHTVAATSAPSVTVRLTTNAATPTEISVTPTSTFTQPPGDQLGAQAWSGSVTTAGLPSFASTGSGLTATDSSITVVGSVSGNLNGSAKPDAYLFIASENGSPNCTNSGDGNISTSSGVITSTSQTISGLTQFHTYEVYVCYTNEYGVAVADLGAKTAWNAPSAPQSWTFDIRNRPTRQYLIDYDWSGTAPSGGTVPNNYVAQFQDPTSGGYQPQQSYQYPADVWGQDPAIQVRYCGNGFLALCTSPSNVTAASGSAPYRLRVSGLSEVCAPSTADQGSGAATTLSASLSMQGDGLSGASAAITSYSYLDSSRQPQSVTLQTPQTTVTLQPGETALQITGYQITLPSGFGGPFTGGTRDITQDPVCTG